MLGTAYFVTDSKLYYYGKSQYNIFNNSLPLEINPDYWGSDISFPIVGLTLKDKNGFVLIAKDESYLLISDTLKVNRIIKYGVSQNKLIALIEDYNNCNYYIECEEDTLQSSKREIVVNILNSNNEIKDDYKWIILAENEGAISFLVLIRACILLLIITLIILITVNLLIGWKKKKKNKI